MRCDNKVKLVINADAVFYYLWFNCTSGDPNDRTEEACPVEQMTNGQ